MAEHLHTAIIGLAIMDLILTAALIDSLFEGIYDVQVFDNNGCSKTSSFNVYEPDSILQYNIATTLSCLNENTGNVSLNISGGVPPYNLDWLGEDPLNIGVGEYNVIVTDDADCVIENGYVVDTLPLPEPSFVIDSVVKVGELVEILNNSEFDVNWYWEFGDNSYSYDENPTALFGTEGSYNVELTTYNVFGCSDTASTTILQQMTYYYSYQTHLLLILIIKTNHIKCLY